MKIQYFFHILPSFHTVVNMFLKFLYEKNDPPWIFPPPMHTWELNLLLNQNPPQSALDYITNQLPRESN